MTYLGSGAFSVVSELAGTRVRRGPLQQVHQRDRGEHAGPAFGARGHGGRVEIAKEREQRGRVGFVEHHLDAVVVHEPQPGGHGVTVVRVGCRRCER